MLRLPPPQIAPSATRPPGTARVTWTPARPVDTRARGGRGARCRGRRLALPGRDSRLDEGAPQRLRARRPRPSAWPCFRGGPRIPGGGAGPAGRAPVRPAPRPRKVLAAPPRACALPGSHVAGGPRCGAGPTPPPRGYGVGWVRLQKV